MELSYIISSPHLAAAAIVTAAAAGHPGRSWTSAAVAAAVAAAAIAAEYTGAARMSTIPLLLHCHTKVPNWTETEEAWWTVDCYYRGGKLCANCYYCDGT